MSYNTQSFRQKKKRIYRIKLTFFIVCVIAVFIGLIFLIRHPISNITDIKIENTKFVDAKEVDNDVREILGESILLFLPKSNFLLFPQFEVEQKIKGNYPSVSDVSFDLQGINRLVISIREYLPKVLWCKGENECFFVNEEGRTYLNEPFIHPYDNLIRFRDVDPNTEIGWDVIDKVFLSNVLDFTEKIKDLNLKISSINSPDEGVYYLETKEGFEILISQTDDLNEAFKNLKVIFEKNAISKEELDLIDYIDLRFGNKVFYKLKE